MQNQKLRSQSYLIPLLILAFLIVEVVTEFSSNTKYCYSCMSEDFLFHWPHLDEVYYRPINFTDHCYKIPLQANIGKIPCSHSMCVTVVEPKILAGQHIGNNIIRGCFSSVFKYGATPKTQNYNFLETSCARMPSYKLLPPRLSSRSSNRTIELCWCSGQLCNNFPSVAMNNSSNQKSSGFYYWFYLIYILIFVKCSGSRSLMAQG